MLGKALIFVAIPFVLTTLYFGTRGGYYDSEDYRDKYPMGKTYFFEKIHESYLLSLKVI